VLKPLIEELPDPIKKWIFDAVQELELALTVALRCHVCSTLLGVQEQHISTLT